MPSASTISPALAPSTLPPRSIARSIRTEPGFIDFTMSVVTRRGAGRPGIGAVAFDLLFGGGPHVGRSDDGAKPPRGRDRLQAGDADAHHEHFCGGNGA